MSDIALRVSKLHISIEGKEILRGVDLEIPQGEIHVVMGPNGSGKSTLANALMGHPRYEVTGGSAEFFGEDLLDLKPHERARLGLFLAHQYPTEVPGVNLAHFLWNAHQSVRGEVGEPGAKKDPKAVLAFRKQLNGSLDELRMGREFAMRHLNVGASGGEKKRLEIAQMRALKPRLALMDEIDSGLDIDSVKLVAESINEMRGDDFTALIITHYPRILEYVRPDRIHVMASGNILCSRGAELAKELESRGYDWLLEEHKAC
jgi:Fe-S cluster assembly ATP-binding protein